MMMIRIIFTIIAIAMAITLILTTTTKSMEDTPRPSKPDFLERKPAPMRRVSRFLEQNGPRNSTAADHCSKDNEICSSILPAGRNATCCNNKCVDLGFDSDNCGACKNKCAFTETCCRGECVDLAYDKRHCGSCNNKCMESGHCIYGLCDYA